MSDVLHISSDSSISLSINNEQDLEYITNIGDALSSVDRIRILRLLSTGPMSVSELSKKLGLAISSISYHVDILAKSQLVFISYQPGVKGHKKLCTRTALSLNIDLSDTVVQENEPVFETVEMPIGNFVDCDVQAPCGLTGRESPIAAFDVPQLLFTPKRTAAQLLWFKSGFITYKFPNNFFFTKANVDYQRIAFSLELCSEAIYCCADWPSDITFYINGIELFTYTSPGDYGGRRGKFTPEYWFINSTQYGLLLQFSVDNTGVKIGDKLVNKHILFRDLHLQDGNGIELKFGIKPDAVHVGGINIFGKNFGDYPQAIVMTISN